MIILAAQAEHQIADDIRNENASQVGIYPRQVFLPLHFLILIRQRKDLQYVKTSLTCLYAIYKERRWLERRHYSLQVSAIIPKSNTGNISGADLSKDRFCQGAHSS